MAQFLVTTDHAVLQGPPTAEMIDGVINDLERLSSMMDEGRILAGGGLAGRRQHAIIVEADSALEVTELVQSLSLWALHEFTITPIEPYRHHLTFLKELRASL